MAARLQMMGKLCTRRLRLPALIQIKCASVRELNVNYLFYKLKGRYLNPLQARKTFTTLPPQSPSQTGSHSYQNLQGQLKNCNYSVHFQVAAGVWRAGPEALSNGTLSRRAGHSVRLSRRNSRTLCQTETNSLTTVICPLKTELLLQNKTRIYKSCVLWVWTSNTLRLLSPNHGVYRYV